MMNIAYVNKSGRYVEAPSPRICKVKETVYVGTKRYWELRELYSEAGENRAGDKLISLSQDRLDLFHKCFKTHQEFDGILILEHVGEKPSF